MIYKFKSKASGNIIMLEPHGDQLLRLIGREPAAKGIIEVEAIDAALQALQAAVAEDGPDPAGAASEREPAVSLRRRLWPMMDMLRRAAAACVPVVWGV